MKKTYKKEKIESKSVLINFRISNDLAIKLKDLNKSELLRDLLTEYFNKKELKK